MNKTLKQVLTSLVLPAVMVLGVVCPLRAWAADVVIPDSEEISVLLPVMEGDDIAMPSNEELLAGYIEQRFAARLPENQGEPELFAQSAGAALTGNSAIIYEQVKAEVLKIAAGERTSTVVTVDLDSLKDKVMRQTWTAEDLGVAAVYENGHLTDEAWQAIQEKVFDADFAVVLHALLLDCPFDLYWFDKGTGCRFGSGMRYYDDDDGSKICVLVNSEVSFSFNVTSPYAADKYEVNTPVADRVSNAIAKAEEIVEDNVGTNSYERLLAFKEAICGLTSYDFDAAAGSVSYGDPWQLVYVFDEDANTKVVCEGYAKAFKYLCDLSGSSHAECLLVTGLMSGGTGAGSHMWNIVKMPDGKSYLVDVTNCDDGTTGYPDKLFMKAPASGSAREGYTYKFSSGKQLTYTYFDGTNVSDGSNMWDYYSDEELTLAATNYDQTSVQEPEAEDLSSASVVASDMTYTGSPLKPQPTVVFGGKTLVAGTNYTVTYANNVNAGEATITVHGKGDYKGAATGTFTINSRELKVGMVSLAASSITYDGSAKEPAVTVVDNGATLAAGTDYTVTYDSASNVNAGTSTVVVSGRGNYQGEVEVNFEIKPRSIEGDNVLALADPDQFFYNPERQKPQVQVTLDDGVTELIEGTDYKLSYEDDALDAGTHEVTVTGMGNYTGKCSAPYEVMQAAPTINILNNEVFATGMVYGQTVNLNVEAQGELTFESSDDAVFTVDAAGTLVATGRGEAELAIRSAETRNYSSGTLYSIVRVDYADLSEAAVSFAAPSFAYTGGSIEPAVTVKVVGRTLVEGTDYTVAYDSASNVNVGTSTVTVMGKGNYTGEATATFAIAKARPVISAADKKVVATKTVKLGATATEGAGTLTYKSLSAKVATVSDTGVVRGVAAGTAKVTVSCAGDDNHEAASKTVTITVVRAPSTLKAKAKKKSVTASLAKVAKASLTLASNLTVSVAKGQQVAYASASSRAVASKFKVNAKNGRVTVAKGTKKGTYTVKVKVTAKQSAVYKAATKTVSYKVVVK